MLTLCARDSRRDEEDVPDDDLMDRLVSFYTVNLI